MVLLKFSTHDNLCASYSYLLLKAMRHVKQLIFYSPFFLKYVNLLANSYTLQKILLSQNSLKLCVVPFWDKTKTCVWSSL